MSGAVTPVTTIPSGIPTSVVSDPPTFRAHFPEFADTTIYPDSATQMWIDSGSVLCPPMRWGRHHQMGVELFTAHMLALQRYSTVRTLGGAPGAVPGLSTGLLNNKSVSKVSVGYDLGTTAYEGAGPWNYTIYGQQFWWWMHLMGIGGYETLAVGLAETLTGTVLTWSRGVMGNWIGPA